MREGTYLSPVILVDRLNLHPDDGCVECGFAYNYEPEGCDSCRPVTELLMHVGELTDEQLIHDDPRRS